MVENVWRFVLPLVFIFFMLFMPLFFVRPKEAYFAHPWVPWCFWNTLVDFFTYSYCSTYNRDFKNVLIPLCITLYHHFNLLSFYNIWIIKFNFHMVWGENHDKGQLISICLYVVIIWKKKPTKIFPGFLP